MALAASVAAAQPSSEPLYFSPSWCPSFADLVDLRALNHVQQDGCCVRVAIPRRELTPEEVARWSAVRQPEPFPPSGCTGREPGSEERAAAATAALRRDVKLWSDEILCATYGQALRSPTLPDHPHAQGAPALVRAEVRTRRLTVNDSLAKAENIRIGVNSCTLYAAWGLPDRQNRTTSRRGVFIQHVYGDTLVYTDNGVITTVQD